MGSVTAAGGVPLDAGPNGSTASGPISARPTYRSALRIRPFRLLLAAHGVGTIAQLMLTLALGIEVLDRTGSGAWVSITVALGFIPYVLASGYAGLLADRHSRSTILTWSFTTRAGCAAALATGLPLHWPIPLLVTLAATAAFAATPSYPALTAATVQAVPDDQLPPANALVTGVVNLTWMTGPGVLGVVLMLGHGPTIGTAIATGLFVLAAATSARARLDRPTRAPSGWWPELRAGWHVVVRVGAVRRPMTAAVLGNFLYGYLVVAMVLLAVEAFGGDRGAGPLNAALSAGGLIALMLSNPLAARFRRAGLLFVVMTIFGVVTVALGLSTSLAVSVASAGLAGAMSLLAEVTSVTLLQQFTPEDLTARVFGVYDQLNVGAIAVGSLIAGPLADALGAGRAVVVVAAGCLTASVVVTRRISHLPSGI